MWLPKAVSRDSNAIQIVTVSVHVRTENSGVGVGQRAPETMVIWQYKGGLTTQQIENKIKESIWEIA